MLSCTLYVVFVVEMLFVEQVYHRRYHILDYGRMVRTCNIGQFRLDN